MKTRVFIIITFIFFIAFSLGCNDTHKETTHEEWLDIIAVVNEEIITKADFALALYQVKAEMINMEQYVNLQKDIQERLEIMSRYDVEDIAFVTIAKDMALMSIAKEKDLIPDARLIKIQVDRVKGFHDENQSPAIVRIILEDVGETFFWEEIMYRMEERATAISNLKSEIYSKHDETRADFFWNDLKRNALLEAEIVILDEDYPVNLYQGLRYAEEYFNLTEKHIEFENGVKKKEVPSP